MEEANNKHVINNIISRKIEQGRGLQRRKGGYLRWGNKERTPDVVISAERRIM